MRPDQFGQEARGQPGERELEQRVQRGQRPGPGPFQEIDDVDRGQVDALLLQRPAPQVVYAALRVPLAQQREVLAEQPVHHHGGLGGRLRHGVQPAPAEQRQGRALPEHRVAHLGVVPLGQGYDPGVELGAGGHDPVGELAGPDARIGTATVQEGGDDPAGGQEAHRRLLVAQQPVQGRGGWSGEQFGGRSRGGRIAFEREDR